LSSTIRHHAARVPRHAVMLALAGLAAAILAGPAPARTPSAAKAAAMTNADAVAAATANFYAALNVMFAGNGQPMKLAWSHAADTVYMGPDGQYLIGWDNIEPRWTAQAAAKLGGHVAAEQLNIVAGADMAIATCIEAGENIVGGKTEAVRLRATNVFRKEGGVWKVISHQTDLLGYMNKPD
jgi:ketosteroid isomerase-like protein